MKKTVQLRDIDVILNFAAVHYCAASWRLGPEWAKGLQDYDLWYVWGGLAA